MAGKSNDFHRLAAELPAKAHALLDVTQAHGLDLSVQLAPIDDGDLKASGVMTAGDDEFSRKVEFTAEHAKPQEFGTMDMQAQPFLRPSFAELQRTFTKDAKGLFK